MPNLETKRKIKHKGKEYKVGEIIDSGVLDPHDRLLIGTATLGKITMRWAMHRWGQVIPCNWSHNTINIGTNMCVPKGYLVADAQNIVVHEAVTRDVEWVLLHEDDVVLPLDAFLKINKYILKGDIPIVSGLYYTKGNASEPLLYRGRGNSFYNDWKLGQKVWVDGVPTGCLLIHTSILKLMYNESESYMATGNRQVRRVFETPAKMIRDPESGNYAAKIGTSDLNWCDRVMEGKYLKRAGWDKVARKKYPFLIDTNLFCGHIDINTQQVYPGIWKS